MSDLELASKGKFIPVSLCDESIGAAVDAGAVSAKVLPFSSFNMRANRKIFMDLNAKHQRETRIQAEYIKLLENLLQEHNIPVPEAPVRDADICASEAAAAALASMNGEQDESKSPSPLLSSSLLPALKDGSAQSMVELINRAKQHISIYRVTVMYRDLNFWTTAPARSIPTVGSTVRAIFMGTGPKVRVDIIKGITGMIRPGKMSLVMGPPGCGKSTFLKALSGLLSTSGGAKLDGKITYNNRTAKEGHFLVPKLVDYINETDVHSAILTVKETLEFAWKASTGGVPLSEVQAKSFESLALFQDIVKSGRLVQDVLTVLGLSGVQDTVVGGDMLKGISGGQKRRVTLGEMMVSRHSVKCCDAISNGLDAATTFDINNTIKIASAGFGSTIVTALLQPAPEVFNLFDDIILLSQGQLIYHGPREQVVSYFDDLGYVCPVHMDVADFLQEIPSPEGKRFIDHSKGPSGSNVCPVGTVALAKRWSESALNKMLLDEMAALESAPVTDPVPAHFNKLWANSLGYYYYLLIERQVKLVYRDKIFLRSRIAQSLIVGGIAGSLFSNLDPMDIQTINGLLFYGVLSVSLAQMSLLSTVFKQRNVFYKQAKALFYPSSAFVSAQTLALVPVFVVESLLFSSILYWSVGLSDERGRFAVYWLVVLSLALCVGQYFRFLGSLLSSEQIAQPMCGVSVVIMVLFCGYIIPGNSVPPGWEWFYHINPISWALRSVTINQYQSGAYDAQVCTSFDTSLYQCTHYARLGDTLLTNRGIPANSSEIWYGLLVMWGEFFLFLIGTTLALTYVRAEVTPPPPIITPEAEEEGSVLPVVIDFEPVSFAFKDIWYTITLPNKHELDLLKGISGYFEPGTVTALIGSSGAGKTTLLDVLAGRKNTGVITGQMFVNGRPKDDQSFRRIMGYVEQFDSLCPHDTAREALEFSAALRLPRGTAESVRKEWVEYVLDMLELMPLEHTLVGDDSSGMSFEQKKRVSIGVELVANPAILFLDEPTSGLDSRAAQVVMRCIKRVAANGRAVVATIHQPSVVIFNQFDALLLLRRGGQTVFFGPLGDENANLQDYFESVSPSIPRLRQNQNPATWMLEVIGAGTGNGGGGGSAKDTIDLHAYYNNSELCAANNIHIDGLCVPHVEADALVSGDPDSMTDAQKSCGIRASEKVNTAPETLVVADICPDTITTIVMGSPEQETTYNATYSSQFTLLMKRSIMSYWRSPSYNFVRMVISVVIALIFASAYSNQKYSTDVDVIARSSVIYITVLFTGVVGMITVQPVFFSERPAFYREKRSEMYSILLYNMATGVVEIPYLLVSSLLFTLPFFFIVGFDKGDVATKFMWYWLFQAMYMSCLVFTGQFLAALMPDPPTAGVIGGVWSTLLSLFCGFMIKEGGIPTFWLFIYWLDPLHYVLEGINVTQFHGDHTPITVTIGATTLIPQVTTAEHYIEEFFPTWDYSQRYIDVGAMLAFIVFFRACTYLALMYVDHKKN